jgi:hypothetical protein
MPTRQKPRLRHRSLDWPGSIERLSHAVAQSEDQLADVVGAPSVMALQVRAEMESQGAAEDPWAREAAQARKALLDDILALLLEAIAIRFDAPTRANGILISTLNAIRNDPDLLTSQEVSVDLEALGALGENYRRGDEESGTYWFDITEIGSEQIEGRQEPAHSQIINAAERAMQELGAAKKRGRPPDESTIVLAKGLAEIFKRYGRQPTRIVDREGEYGDWYEFVHLVVRIANKEISFSGSQDVKPFSAARVLKLGTAAHTIRG